MRQTRTALAALCVGLAVFFALQSISSSVATKTAVTATRAIKRGQTIRADDLKTVQIADSPALANVFSSDGDVKGLVAQVDIENGSVISRPMARASPVIGHGLTTIDVKISGSSKALIPGDKVSLVGSGGCASLPDAPDQNPAANRQTEADTEPANASDASTTGTGEPANGQTPTGQVEEPDTDVGTAPSTATPPTQSDEQTCILASQATVTGNPHRDESGNVTTMLAMPPRDAARIMAAQERMPILAAKL
ncbi:SAF domain-containing protein [Bifidobacterium sp. ESL0800]|uniref:SAF domain-containing protein n=1 Tax=Bifidobacterium sp. ESL0800 TaxID=2983236 RepID=UPI0023F697EA|nr:SAF domain-containing protein [Bifidobacterium sp. ESL0800]WEV75694.1 SAF domain-containing protein [Bifidobacterium sp. ESL0800]